MSTYSFKVKSIYALENSFKRLDHIDLEEYDNAEHAMDITITEHSAERPEFINISLKIEIRQTLNDQIIVEGLSEMVGIFAIEGEAPEHVIEGFSRINAPAIIFPYAREYFTSASVRANLPPILIQPINFVEHEKQLREKQTKIDDPDFSPE